MKIEKKCPKCGHDDTNLHYYNEGDKISGIAVIPCKEYCGEILDPRMSAYIRSTVQKECIHLHCRTCQYDWSSDVIDNTKSPSNSTETSKPINAFGLDAEAIRKLAEELNAPFGPPFFNEGNGYDSAGDPNVHFYPSTTCTFIFDDVGNEQWSHTCNNQK